MAINLNPGADPTLVTAATRAGLAAAPQDYSGTFENVALNYQQTMMATSKMWGSVIEAAGVAALAIDKYIKGPQKSPQTEDLLGTDAGKLIFDKLELRIILPLLNFMRTCLCNLSVVLNSKI